MRRPKSCITFIKLSFCQHISDVTTLSLTVIRAILVLIFYVRLCSFQQHTFILVIFYFLTLLNFCLRRVQILNRTQGDGGIVGNLNMCWTLTFIPSDVDLKQILYHLNKSTLVSHFAWNFEYRWSKKRHIAPCCCFTFYYNSPCFSGFLKVNTDARL